jgi:ubiquitin-conjugating enzyme E2 Z
MSVFISRETTKRLIKDVKDIIKNPLNENGIYYIHDETDMMKGYALIIGPSDTPYFGGYYFFKIEYPKDYPHSPPLVTYCTNGKNIRFNPNLYKCGKVCISLLNTWRGDQWTSCQTISSVLITLCTLLCKDPLLNEPGVTDSHRDFEKYNQIIEFNNIDVAVCDILLKKEGVYLDFFHSFEPFLIENFKKNYDSLESFIKTKLDKKSHKLTTTLYNINTTINYKLLYTKLQNINKNIK